MTEHIIIDAKKDVMVPETLRESITQWDHEIQEIIIDCPRYWYYEKDIYGLQFYVNYLTSKNAKGKKTLSTPCTVTLGDTEDMLQITWPIRRSLSQYDGPFAFLLCAKGVDENGNETPHWNSHLCKDMTIMEGLESNLQEMVEEYPDVITSLLLRVDALEKNGGGTSFNGSAADVTYNNEKSKLDAENVQDALDKLQEEIVDLQTTLTGVSELIGGEE